MLEEDLGDNIDSSSKKDLTQMHQRIARMEKLLNDLLAYSKITSQTEYKCETTPGRIMIREVKEILSIPDN